LDDYQLFCLTIYFLSLLDRQLLTLTDYSFVVAYERMTIAKRSSLCQMKEPNASENLAPKC